MPMLFDSWFSIATCGANTFGATNGIVSLLTLDARTSYPWPLAWGNALWGYVAYKKYRQTLMKQQRPGFLWGCLVTFVLYTMPANIFTNLLIFGRTPSALTSSVVLPIHIFVCVMVEMFRPLYELFKDKFALAVIDTMGVLDNVTTGYNFLIEMAVISKASPYVSILAGMCTNLAGGFARHFMMKGFANGISTFDEVFQSNIFFSFCINALYYYYAVVECPPQYDRRGHFMANDHQLDCPLADKLYMAVPIFMALKNLLPMLVPELDEPLNMKHKKYS